MKPQVYLPAFCASCLGSHLLPADSGEGLRCPTCGASASAIPGESYGEADVPLFARLAAAVDADLRGAPVAQKVMAELRDARRRSEALEAILLRLTDDVPGLRFLLPALYPNRTTPADRLLMGRALGMLVALVGAQLRRFEAGVSGSRARPGEQRSTPEN